MIDISKFVTVEDGKAVFDKDAYQSAYDADLRKALDSNSENTKKKLEAEIRKQVEEEAKLSAEQKLEKARADFETEMSTKRKEFAQYQAKAKMANAGMEEDEINSYLELVSDEASISKIDKILELRSKREEALKKKWEESIVANQPNPEGSQGSEPENIGAIMAKQYQGKSQDGPKVTAWGTTN